MLTRYLCTLAFLTSWQASAAPRPEDVKGIADSMAIITALTEQLNPHAEKSVWEDPRIPGAAADRKQALGEMGCVYDLPIDPSNEELFPFGRIEVSGEHCPIHLVLELGGKMIGNHIEATFNIHYQLKKLEAFPKDDLTAFDVVGTFSGDVEGGEQQGFMRVNLTGSLNGSGTSRVAGPFVSNVTMGVMINASGFGFEMNTSESNQLSIGGKSGSYRSEIKLQMFGAQENYWIDDQPVDKDVYRAHIGEWKFPFINFNTTPSGPGQTMCRAEVYAANAVTEAQLQEYVTSGASPGAAPVKAVNSCQTNMLRTAEWGQNALTSEFKFGREYLVVRSLITFGSERFDARPLYVLYDERMGRVESAKDIYLVQICEPVRACQ